MLTDFSLGYITQKKERLREKKNSNVPNKNLLESAQGELPQREERIRKTFFCDFILTDLLLG